MSPQPVAGRRIRIAAGALGILAALFCSSPGIARVSGPSRADLPSQGPAHFEVVLPVVSRDGAPPRMTLSATDVYQGGAFLVRVENATSGWVSAFGRTVPLLAGPNGELEAFVGAGTGETPGPAGVRVNAIDAVGDAVTLSGAVRVRATQWTVDYIVLPPGVGSGLTPEIIQAEEARLARVYGEVTSPRWQARWGWPVDPADPRIGVSGYFGEQRSFDGGPPTGHHGGTDIGAPAGTPVMATNSGVVVLAEELAVRGRMVIIDHGGGVFSGYAHLQDIAVAAGEAVIRGQVLGGVGTTGLSTGPHLHWEVSVGGVLLDGLRWLDGSQGF